MEALSVFACASRAMLLLDQRCVKYAGGRSLLDMAMVALSLRAYFANLMRKGLDGCRLRRLRWSW